MHGWEIRLSTAGGKRDSSYLKVPRYWESIRGLVVRAASNSEQPNTRNIILSRECCEPGPISPINIMSLLSVTVKKARYVGGQGIQFNTYVTLKLQNVKSTTVTVKGPNPTWNQDFLFETNDVNTGLLMEVWNKGMLWDRALGYHWLPLPAVHYSNEEGPGEWVSLDAELVMMDGEVVGTKEPTGHSLLVDCRFELPFDAENTEAADLQRKLEALNSIVDQEARAEQARRQMQYFGHSGYSEDSDYTSDLNYPVGQHANSSASQFRSAAHQMPTPQRSLETSRENSYETDEPPPQHHQLPHHGHHLSPGQPAHSRRRAAREDDYYGSGVGGGGGRYIESEAEPLYYNSRPRNHKEPYRRRQRTWDYEDSPTGWYDESGGNKWDTHASCPRIYEGTRYYQPRTSSIKRKDSTKGRRPSLERQTTLYDDHFYGDSVYNQGDQQYSHDNRGFDQTNEYGSKYHNYGSSTYKYHDTRYGQEEEDRQWDSGGSHRRGRKSKEADFSKPMSLKEQYENQMNKKYSSKASLKQHRQYSSDQDDVSSAYYTPRQSYEDEDYHPGSDYIGTTARRKMPSISGRHSGSRHSVPDDFAPPPRKSKGPKLLPQIPTKIKPSPSLPPTPVRQKPQVPSTILASPLIFSPSLPSSPTSLLPEVSTSPDQNRPAHKSLPPTPIRHLPQVPTRRTNSLEHEESTMDDRYGNIYSSDTRLGKSAYNEDYNYAYRSSDNLTPQEVPQVIQPQEDLHNRTSSIQHINKQNQQYSSQTQVYQSHNNCQQQSYQYSQQNQQYDQYDEQYQDESQQYNQKYGTQKHQSQKILPSVDEVQRQNKAYSKKETYQQELNSQTDHLRQDPYKGTDPYKQNQYNQQDPYAQDQYNQQEPFQQDQYQQQDQYNQQSQYNQQDPYQQNQYNKKDPYAQEQYTQPGQEQYPQDQYNQQDPYQQDHYNQNAHQQQTDGYRQQDGYQQETDNYYAQQRPQDKPNSYQDEQFGDQYRQDSMDQYYDDDSQYQTATETDNYQQNDYYYQDPPQAVPETQKLPEPPTQLLNRRDTFKKQQTTGKVEEEKKSSGGALGGFGMLGSLGTVSSIGSSMLKKLAGAVSEVPLPKPATMTTVKTQAVVETKVIPVPSSATRGYDDDDDYLPQDRSSDRKTSYVELGLSPTFSNHMMNDGQINGLAGGSMASHSLKEDYLNQLDRAPSNSYYYNGDSDIIEYDENGYASNVDLRSEAEFPRCRSQSATISDSNAEDAQDSVLTQESARINGYHSPDPDDNTDSGDDEDIDRVIQETVANFDGDATSNVVFLTIGPTETTVGSAIEENKTTTSQAEPIGYDDDQYEDQYGKYEDEDELYKNDSRYSTEDERKRYLDETDEYLSKQDSLDRDYSTRQDSLDLDRDYPSDVDRSYGKPSIEKGPETNGRGYLEAQASVDSYYDDELPPEDYDADSPVSVVDPSERGRGGERNGRSGSYDENRLGGTGAEGAGGSPTVSPSLPPILHHQGSMDEEALLEQMNSHLPDPDAGLAKRGFDDEIMMDEPLHPPRPTMERRKLTPKERWHWAYNKIVHQLTVSGLA
ncbi:Hypothetical protein NTJ_06965 [Nesidiocoris tenuis]|uniref:C2 domain-containing protein n=1 Tax=Nesidiocoris tenuis TaxID=355587 RepID=A0ABN7ATE1_9HEMI|nr:Hypothetical protein NTJ_06965 [Nesidiocoris tenuis]